MNDHILCVHINQSHSSIIQTKWCKNLWLYRLVNIYVSSYLQHWESESIILSVRSNSANPWTVAHQVIYALNSPDKNATAVPFSRGSSLPRDQTWISCTAGRFFTMWATRKDRNTKKSLQIQMLMIAAMSINRKYTNPWE